MWEVSPHLQPIVNRESDTGILIPDSVGNRLQGSLKTVPLSRPRPERRLSLRRVSETSSRSDSGFGPLGKYRSSPRTACEDG
jgi:hypothetical protein